MRETKYRAKHKGTGEWYYGSSLTDDLAEGGRYDFSLSLFWLTVEREQLDVNTVGANNYYTSRQNCDYINDVANKVFIIDDKCVGSNYVACKQNEASSFIADFFNNGQIVGKCGVECIEDTDCNQDVQDVRYGCDKKDSLNIVEKNVCLNNICSFKTDIDNIGKILGKCGVECLTDTNCNDDFVNETCEDMNSVDVLTNNFCSDENVCSFSVSKTDNGIILDKCNVECLANIDCVSYCGDKQPTCDTGICGCSYQIDSTNYIKIFLLEYKYIAMFVAFLIVGIYAITRKTKKRGKKRRS